MTEPSASDRSTDVVVVGAGVSGLTTAICLAEAGYAVRVWSAEAPDQTTSMAAGAMWGPYLVEPKDKVEQWSLTTLAVLKDLAEIETSGVRLVTGLDASRTGGDPPDWAKQLDDFRAVGPDELPPGFSSGVEYTAPMVDMPVYLGYLVDRLQAAGSTVEVRSVASFGEAFAAAGTVVNCSGVGARELVPDLGVTAIRGQLVSIENVGITDFFTEDTGESAELLHIYPHNGSVILGGVAQPDSWDRRVDHELAKQIVKRTSAVEPRIAKAKVLAHRVGLRPTRTTIRVECEQFNEGRLLHNYGHGGAGVSLSWGCAGTVLDLCIGEGKRPRQ